MITSSLRHFALSEFTHHELVDNSCAVWLDDIRQSFGGPLIVTSAARTLEENTALPDSSPTSLHLLGRAFDLRWTFTPEELWRLVDAIYLTSGERGTEVEFVPFGAHRHLHIGLYPNGGHSSRLEVRAD